jgi:hypothetical protein
MPTVTNFPMRRIAELLAMPTTKGSCSVPPPLSPVSGLLLGWLQRECGFACVHCTRWLLVALDGGETENLIVGGCLKCVLQSPWSAEILVRAPFLQFFPCSPSVTRSVLFPRPAALRCSASFATANALRVWVSNNKFPAQHARGCGPADEISRRSLRRKHISALGAGHLTSLRARVSRGSSGQKPIWRKSSWHSTKTPSA